MGMFSVNTLRIDPYKNFRFQISFNGGTSVVAAVQKVSGLKKTTEVIDWREAGNSSVVRKMAGRTSYAPITCEAGLTHDPEFETWANLVNTYIGPAGAGVAANDMSLANFRKELVLTLLNEQGTAVIAYKIHRVWVSEFQAMPDLDANGKAVAITSIKMEHEGFERDASVTEPKET